MKSRASLRAIALAKWPFHGDLITIYVDALMSNFEKGAQSFIILDAATMQRAVSAERWLPQASTIEVSPKTVSMEHRIVSYDPLESSMVPKTTLLRMWMPLEDVANNTFKASCTISSNAENTASFCPFMLWSWRKAILLVMVSTSKLAILLFAFANA